MTVPGLLFTPVVITMTFETSGTGCGMTRLGIMAALTHFDPGDQNVGCFLALANILMATGTIKHDVRRMIEIAPL